MPVAVGIDSHKRTLAVGVVDALGKPRATREFRNDPKGHRRLLHWVRSFGEVVIGVEGAGHYGAGSRGISSCRHETVTVNVICSLNNITDGRAFLGIGYGDSSVKIIGAPATAGRVGGTPCSG